MMKTEKGTFSRCLILSSNKLITVMILVALIFVVQSRLPRKYNFVIGNDGFHYYAYIRSLMIDHDFRVENEIEYINSQFHPSLPKLKPLYYWPLGSGITWSPALALGIGIERLTGYGGFPGFSTFTQLLVSLLSVFYAFLGIWFSLESVKRFFPEIRINWTILIIPFTTPLLYYLLFMPASSHLPSFCSIAFLFYLYSKNFYQNGSPLSHYMLFYAAGGAATLIRWNNVLVFIVLVFAILIRNHSPRDLRRHIFSVPLFIIVFSPQFLFWKSIFGSYFTYPHSGSFLSFLNPKIVEFLFSMRHGLFSWTPVYLLSLIGIFGFLFYLRKYSVLVFIYFGAFLSQLYINSIVSDWWSGASFGQRRFISFIPFLIMGVLFLLKQKKKITTIALWLLLIFNILFVLQYQTGRIPPADAITFKQYLPDKIAIPADVVNKIKEITK